MRLEFDETIGRRAAEMTALAEGDDALMARICDRDAAAYRIMVTRHLERTHAIAWRMMGNTTDAEDIAQEALIRLWDRPEKYQPGRAKFTTWFYRLVVNLCIDRQRRRRPTTDIDAIAEPEDDAKNGEEELQDKQQRARVRRALEELPERQRAALVLCYFEGMSNAEAAESLETTVTALEGLLVRARRKLRAVLLEEEVGECQP